MTTKVKKTLADLSAKYDRAVAIPRQISAAIEALAKSGDDYAYELDFCKLVTPAVPVNQLSQHREAFADFWAEVRDIGRSSSARRVWFPSKALCKKWKEQVGG